MKKQWLPLVFAVLLMLAPIVRAEDDSAAGSFEQLIAQLVALIVGDESEIGEVMPPNGASAQPGGDEPEIGSIMPPWG
jgi:hypothetical protein